METNLQCIELKKTFFREPTKFKSLEQVMKNDPHKLTVSPDTQEEHNAQIAHNDQVNQYISSNDDNALIS